MPAARKTGRTTSLLAAAVALGLAGTGAAVLQVHGDQAAPAAQLSAAAYQAKIGHSARATIRNHRRAPATRQVPLPSTSATTGTAAAAGTSTATSPLSASAASGKSNTTSTTRQSPRTHGSAPSGATTPVVPSTPASTTGQQFTSPSAPASPSTAGQGGTTIASGPNGVAGTWTPVFDDEFNGTSLDRTRWSNNDGWSVNDVTTRSSNVSVSGGNLALTLSSSTEGAAIDTSADHGAGATAVALQVGDYAEARMNFPGDGQSLYNWPAWWTSGPNWPAGGENDIAEILGGDLTVNYHSSSGAHNQGAVPGYWGGGYHVYGLHLMAGHADVYWDGKLVKSYPTDDNGAGQALILNVGKGDTGVVTGAASRVLVDWVRAYRPGA